MGDTQSHLEPTLIDRVIQIEVTREGSRKVDTYVGRLASYYLVDGRLHIWFHGQPVALMVSEKETIAVLTGPS